MTPSCQQFKEFFNPETVIVENDFLNIESDTTNLITPTPITQPEPIEQKDAINNCEKYWKAKFSTQQEKDYNYFKNTFRRGFDENAWKKFVFEDNNNKYEIAFEQNKDMLCAKYDSIVRYSNFEKQMGDMIIWYDGKVEFLKPQKK